MLTRDTPRDGPSAKLIPCCAEEILLSSVIVLRHWKTCVTGHTNAPHCIPRNVDDLETVEFAGVLGAIAEDQHLTRCAQVCFRGTERTKPNNMTTEQLTKFWEIKTWNKEEMLRKKTIEKLTCLNRCLYAVTENPRRKAWHLGFVFLAVLALRSGDYIETCDIYRKKHSCKWYVLLELHKIKSMLQRHFDAKDATTQSRDLKHTKYRHLDFTHSITRWESMCSRSLTQSACAPQS